ncbi:hypothetical protein EJ02DRAFT_470053 [Clathrospora elynae]|uniref:CST complex subunit Stn1 N-terminal domain-containing protein n=1 Tax=Clathrospora elynae TaxID=706981 RepID=A0A6A5SHU0_9PLEO|nr:hypothetical protein EJ02DRAFT_470053 [Clathrospora elynae]
MSTHPPARPYRAYSAIYFRASPTFNAWVKLTAADVQALRSEPEYQGQHIYFHLNHPIRFVCVVGVIVAIDDINLRYTVLTIDDGSGATVEVKIVRTPPIKHRPVETSSNTTIENVNIISQSGVFEIMVDNHQLDIGTVIKSKCTISMFRGIKQLELKRVWVVTTTNEEAQAWAEAAAFKQEVLSTPWHVSTAEGENIKKSIWKEKIKAKDYDRKYKEYEIKKEKQKQAREAYWAQREVKLERRRRKEEPMMNAGALI